MTIIECNLRSKTLLFPTTIKVLLPESFPDLRQENLSTVKFDITEKFRTLYLLHGATDGADSWLLNSRVRHYANQHNLAVVLPDAQNSFYADRINGPAFWTYLSEELPSFIRSLLPLSRRREDNYVAGLSMGGYGALKFALRKPEMFSAVISLSGVVDIISAFRDPIHPDFNADAFFGGLDQLRGSDNDLFALIDKLISSKTPIPKIYFACGTDDFLLDMNRKFRDHLEKLGVNFCYEEGPGEHDWDFWDEYIQRGLDCIDSGFQGSNCCK